MSNVAVMDPRPNLQAGARPQAIVPRTMDEAYRLGKAICMAGMAPKGMDTPEKCMIAIMRGLEVGLSPMQAIDKIAVVNGRPTIWGDGAMALVRASGLCEYVREWMAGEGEARAAVCETKRRGERDPIVRRFSVAEARRAGLWDERQKVRRKSKDGGFYEADNDAPWFRFPKRMLQMRARAFALRDGFADVLGGLYLKEEMDDRGELPDPAPRQIAAPAAPQIDHAPDDGLFDEARLKAQDGSRAFAEWLYAQPVEQRERLWDINDELEALMAHADAEQGEMEPA